MHIYVYMCIYIYIHIYAHTVKFKGAGQPPSSQAQAHITQVRQQSINYLQPLDIKKKQRCGAKEMETQIDT